MTVILLIGTRRLYSLNSSDFASRQASGDSSRLGFEGLQAHRTQRRERPGAVCPIAPTVVIEVPIASE